MASHSSRGAKGKAKSTGPPEEEPWSERTWSEEHKAYYRFRQNSPGVFEYDWDTPRESPQVPRSALSYTASSIDTTTSGVASTYSPAVDSLATNLAEAHLTDPTTQTYASPSNTYIAANDPETNRNTLDPRYQTVKDGSRFFKVGRVFKILWPEPAHESADDDADVEDSVIRGPYGEMIHTKVRPLVVVREQKGRCICIPLTTYGGQGTLKRGVNPDNHAVAYDSRRKPTTKAGEKMQKRPFPIKVEDPQEKIDPMTRLEFSKVYTVEHNVKVLKIGRIPDEHLNMLRRYFADSMADPDLQPTMTGPGGFPPTPESYGSTTAASPGGSASYYQTSPYDGRAFGGQPFGGQPFEDQPYDGRAFGDQPFEGQPFGGQPHGG